MIRRLHALRRHEEGQALVLAAISMLILTLCVLATINLTYAAKERIRLQNAADSAAYTTAAYQARAMNYFAYTNRAMTIHYASQMNLMAVMSFMAFTMTIATLLKQFSFIPYIGWIFTLIYYIVYISFWILAIYTAVMLPAIDGANLILGLSQTAVAAAMQYDLLSAANTEVKKYNSNYQADTLSSVLLTASPALLGVNQVVNTNPMPNLNQPSGTYDPQAMLNRMMMIEIANSARHQWTAYGKGKTVWLGLAIPRSGHIGLDLGVFAFDFGREGRTEWGAIKGAGPGGGTIGGIVNGFLGGMFTPTEQLYSIDRLFLTIRVLILTFNFYIDGVARADRAALFNLISNIFSWAFGIGQQQNSIYVTYRDKMPSVPWWARWLTNFIVKPIQTAVKSFLSQVKIPKVPLFHFGEFPYARYKPLAHVGPQGAKAGLFNQPPVVLMATAPTGYLTSTGQPFMGHFGVKLGTLTSASGPNGKETLNASGTRTYAQSRNTSASKRGFVDSVDFKPGDKPYFYMQSGFHAMSASMAYYHRPGDWREPPNLFNPFWGAKLMPVGDYPTMQNNVLFHTLFTTNLMVH